MVESTVKVLRFTASHTAASLILHLGPFQCRVCMFDPMSAFVLLCTSFAKQLLRIYLSHQQAVKTRCLELRKAVKTSSLEKKPSKGSYN